MEPIFSVAEFNELVGNHLTLLGEVVVEGELSELKISQGKWVYATLKDEEASVNVFATVYQIHNIRSLEVGMKVKVTGTAGLYKKTARFSLNARDIVPSGEGALLAAYEKLKAQLSQEGLFDPSRKRSLPLFPERIGLLTARDSQAYQDFVKVSSQRIGGFKIYFYPVNVQGAGSVESILSGLTYFNKKNHVDVIVITRGGGSLEDLASFNDERIVRAVYASTIPTVCAIGHEGDVSLIELAADMRGSTPSNAAELIFQDKNAVIHELHTSATHLEDRLTRQVGEIERETTTALQSMSHYLDRSISAIMLSLHTFTRVVEQTVTAIDAMMVQVDQKNGELMKTVDSGVKILSERIGFAEEKLRSVDPMAVLKRGFSIVKDTSGHIVKSINQLAVGQNLFATVSDGTVESKVVTIQKEQNGRHTENN